MVLALLVASVTGLATTTRGLTVAGATVDDIDLDDDVAGLGERVDLVVAVGFLHGEDEVVDGAVHLRTQVVQQLVDGLLVVFRVAELSDQVMNPINVGLAGLALGLLADTVLD